MKSFLIKLIFVILIIHWNVIGLQQESRAADYKEVPVKGMVTLVDIGAGACIPCKMMAPILEKLEKGYQGKAAIIFLDVWLFPDLARKFGVRVIPTQIFYDKEGQEVYRHIGFMSEKEIVDRLKKMGVR